MGREGKTVKRKGKAGRGGEGRRRGERKRGQGKERRERRAGERREGERRAEEARARLAYRMGRAFCPYTTVLPGGDPRVSPEGEICPSPRAKSPSISPGTYRLF